MNEQPFAIDSGGVKLEGLLHEGAADLAGVVLHPHPQYGGDMHNHVVAAVCEALAAHGATTLRFNFRGTGGSEGAYDSAHGESDDARAAVASIRALRPNSKLVLAGYSFGAMIAAHIANEVRPDTLVLVSLPAGSASASHLAADTAALLITGERDGVAPPDGLDEFNGPNRTIIIVPNVDHGWWPGADILSEAVRTFVNEQFPNSSL